MKQARAKSINASRISNGNSLFEDRKPLQVEYIDKRQIRLRKEMDDYADYRKRKYEKAVAEALEMAKQMGVVRPMTDMPLSACGKMMTTGILTPAPPSTGADTFG